MIYILCIILALLFAGEIREAMQRKSAHRRKERIIK